MVSCLLKHFIRKIKTNAVRRFDVSNIIIKNMMPILACTRDAKYGLIDYHCVLPRFIKLS